VVWCAGAYVILQSAKDAAKAVQLLRQEKGITAMTYADYFNSKGHGRSSSSSSGGGSTARPIPQSISLVEAVSSMPTAADSRKVVEDLRAAAAAKSAEKQAQEQLRAKQQQQQQQQQQHEADAEPAAMRESSNAALSDGQELRGRQSGAEAAATDSNDRSSSSAAKGSPVDAGSGALQSAAQQQRPIQQLQRPTMRPMPQENST
jgi:hypothetical protein